MFSEQDMTSIIAGASDAATVTKKYGDNESYDAIKEQEVEENGAAIKIYSIIDMIFEDSYIHSFSLTYRDKLIGLNDYNNMLASFKVGKMEQQEKHNKEYYLRLEREERARKEAEKQAKLANEQKTIEEQKTTEVPTSTSTPEPTVTPKPTIIPSEAHTIETQSGEIIAKEEIINNKIEEVSGDAKALTAFDNETLESGNDISNEENKSGNDVSDVENESGNVVIDEITINISNIQPKGTSNSQEVSHPTKPKKTNMFFAIISLPIVRNLIIFCVLFDVTITLIIKHRKKKKKEQNEKDEQNQAK
jgi:hypothetical protein